jgi:cob(I)alamin adenosyltransferase
MKVYTGTGDQGTTSVYGKERVDKDCTLLEVMGNLDELNSLIGVAANFIEDKDIRDVLRNIQRELFTLGGMLLVSGEEEFSEGLAEKQVENMEEIMDVYLKKMSDEEKNAFIIPGSGKASAFLHLARTVCRRTERKIVSLGKEKGVSSIILKYINRLSDLLYTLARHLEEEIHYVKFGKE